MSHPFGNPEQCTLHLGEPSLEQAQVTSDGCRTCVAEPGRHLGCCAVPASWTLADVAMILVREPGGERFVRRLLKTGRVLYDGLAIQAPAARDKCPFHRQRGGCTLPLPLRPLLCRVYLCSPGALMPAQEVQGYQEYRAGVQVLEEHLTWSLWHQGIRLGVSSLSDIRTAALRALAGT